MANIDPGTFGGKPQDLKLREMDYFSEFEKKKRRQMRGKTKYAILTTGIDVTRRGNRLVSAARRSAGKQFSSEGWWI